MPSTKYGELIRQLRKNAGLTQKELGKACGFDGSSADRTVRSWERGEYLPTLNIIRALANALNVSLDMLVP